MHKQIIREAEEIFSKAMEGYYEATREKDSVKLRDPVKEARNFRHYHRMSRDISVRPSLQKTNELLACFGENMRYKLKFL